MWLKKWIKNLCVAYLAYIAFLIILVTPLANHFLVPVYKQQTGRLLKTNGIGINPFTLTVFLYRSEDRNPSGDILWSLDELSVNLSLASLLGTGLVLDGLGIKGLYVHPEKLQDGRWAFDDILRHRASMSIVEESPVDESHADGLPALTVHHIDFHAKHLGYTDQNRPEPFTASLEQIRISLMDFSTVVEEGKPYHLIARDESGGELEWKGTLSVPGRHSQGELTLRKISLMPLWRFIQSDVNFRMHSAFLDMGGKYELSWEDAVAPDYRIQEGFLALTEVDIRPKAEKESGLQIKALSLDGVTVESHEKAFSARALDLDEFRGTVSILENGTTNFQSMFSAAERKSTDADSVSKKKATTGDASPWSIALEVIRIQRAAFAFNDYSIDPDFRVRIQDFGGEIKPINSDSRTVTAVNLAGNVDGYAPVTLTGTVKPQSIPLDLNLAFDFRGIEMSSFTGYSGTYAGHQIDSGVLTVSLRYRLNNNRIQGANRVVINQLTLGKRVKSPRLLDLPLRLALALLTDENGVIDLEVDVSGDTQNPDFSIGKIILKAFRNVIVKAVSAPFRLLANLVGSETSEYVSFPVGSSVLPDGEKGNLDKLRQALEKRPQLNLGLSGLYDEDDRLHLKRQQFHAALSEQGIDAGDIEDESWSFRRYINKTYEARWPMDDQQIPVAEKYLRLVNAASNPELKLEQLRQERAMAVKLFLLQELKMDPARVYLDNSLHSDKQHAVKLLLDAR